MQKIRLLAHTADAAVVLDAVQRAGVVEFAQVRDTTLAQHEPKEFALHYASAGLDFAVEFLQQYAPKKGALAVALEGNQEAVTDARIKDVVASFYATDIVDAAQDLQKNLNDTTKKVKELRKERGALLPWRRVPLVVGRSHDTVYTKTAFVVLGNAQVRRKNAPHHDLAKALSDHHVLYHIVSVDPTRAVVTWYVGGDGVGVAEDVLKDCGYEHVVLQQRRGTPEEEIVRIDRAIVKAQKEIAQYEETARTMAQHLPALKIISDYTLWQKDRHALFVHARRTREVLVYEGWCPVDRLAILRKDVATATALAQIEEVAPAKDEEPPVEIANASFLRPFEAVTRLYGLPSAQDIDPTPYLAAFFFVFFGFCLTDVGYGLILMALTGFALMRYNVASGTKTMLQLLFLGGLSSAFAGVLFGGYFGVDMSKMPQILQDLQKLNPIQNPLPVFYVALALGVVQVLFSLVVAIIAQAKRGDFWGGMLDHAPWIAFFVALGLFVADKMALLTFALATPVLYGAIALLVLTQGRSATNPFAKIAKGVMSLYDVVAYFSDILSYSRLLALGLATSALAFAINMIAAMVAGEHMTIFSAIMAGIILVIGHLFNLVVNTLGAFIHSARLQFVEFFGKFITGTGRVFAPCRRTERYTVFREGR